MNVDAPESPLDLLQSQVQLGSGSLGDDAFLHFQAERALIDVGEIRFGQLLELDQRPAPVEVLEDRHLLAVYHGKGSPDQIRLPGSATLRT